MCNVMTILYTCILICDVGMLKLGLKTFFLVT